MYKWFRDCKTAEEGKALYHELVKKHHSDNGGNDGIMAEINDEFTRWWKEFKNIHTAADGNTYTKETSEDITQFMDILDKLSRHQNLKVDICGSWLWISGMTYQIKDSLAAYGCHWSRGKKKWFWAADVLKKEGKGHLSEAEITRKYGRKSVNLEYNPVLGIE